MSTEPQSEPRRRTPRRTQAERRASTEARLLDAAITLVAEGGVRAVTTAAVGERAGFSRGIVTHHFGSRDVLMARTAETVQARFRPRAHSLHGTRRVSALVDDYLANVADQPEDSRVFLRLWAAAAGDEEPSLAAAFIERDRTFRTAFEEALAEGIAEDAIDSATDASALAAILVGLVRGVAMQWQVSPHLIDLKAVRQQVERLLTVGLVADRDKRSAARSRR